MFKTCLDCIAGEQRQNEDPYRVNTNGAGGQQAPHWQRSNNGTMSTMFPTPALRPGQKIIIKGQMNNNRLHISFGSDSGTIFELQVELIATEDSLKLFSNGTLVHERNATSYFADDGRYTLTFQMSENRYLQFAHILVGTASLENVELQIDEIKNISADGEIKMLTFVFVDDDNVSS